MLQDQSIANDNNFLASDNEVSSFYDPTLEEGDKQLDESAVYSVDGKEVTGKDLLSALNKADQSVAVIDQLQAKVNEMELTLAKQQAYQQAQQDGSPQQQTIEDNEPEVTSKVVDFFGAFDQDSQDNMVSVSQLRGLGEALVEDFTNAMQSSLRDPAVTKPAFDHHLGELGRQDQSNKEIAGQVNQAYEDFIGQKATQTNKSREALEALYKPALERVHTDQTYLIENKDPATVLRGALDEVDRVIDNYDSIQNQPQGDAVEQKAAASLDVGQRFRTALPKGRESYFSEDEARAAFREGVKRAKDRRQTFG